MKDKINQLLDPSMKGNTQIIFYNYGRGYIFNENLGIEIEFRNEEGFATFKEAIDMYLYHVKLK
jgi:hypothetical protein